MLNGGAVSWCSCKQSVMAGSTCDTKYMAVSEAAHEAIKNYRYVGDVSSSYQTYDKVYIRSGTQHGIHNRPYGPGIGDDTHLFSMFCPAQALSGGQLYSL